MPRSESPPHEKRLAERVEVAWNVDCETEETFLFASITNVSELGIFVRTTDPLAVGTVVSLRFAACGDTPFVLRGRVQWINQVAIFGENINPGMGIMFLDLAMEERERLVSAIRTIAYLRGDPQQLNPN